MGKYSYVLSMIFEFSSIHHFTVQKSDEKAGWWADENFL